ncbi:MAG: ABC transporter permease [Bacteriovoracaceae bacterium]
MTWLYLKKVFLHQKRLWLQIFFMIALGFFSPVLVEVIKSGVDQYLSGNLSRLLGSDLVMSSRLALPEKKIEEFAEESTFNGETPKLFNVYSLYTMATSNERTRLLQLVLVPEGYPIYGSLIPNEHKESFHSDDVLWALPEAMNLFQASLEDKVKIGSRDFKIKGIIENDPGALVQGQALAPKVYLSVKHFKTLGLISKGSTVRYKKHFKLPDNWESERKQSFIQDFKTEFEGKGVNVRTPKENGEFVSRSVKIIGDFLGLGSFVCLVMAIVAISFVIQKSLQKQKESMKNLYQLGQNTFQAFKLYAFGYNVLGLLAAALICLVCFLGLPIVMKALSENFNLAIEKPAMSFYLLKSGQFLISYILLTIFLISFELKSIYKEKTLNRLYWISLSLLIAYLAFMAFIMTPSVQVLLSFWGGIIVSLVLVVIVSKFIFVGLEKYFSLKKRPYRFAGISYMTRFSVYSIASIFLLALTIGLFGLVNSLSEGLKIGLSFEKNQKLPGLFLFDIQPEQNQKLEDVLAKHGASSRRVLPLVRARLIKIDGKEVTELKEEVMTRESERRDRFLERGVNLSYQAKLSPSEKIIEGEDFFSQKPEEREVPYVSIEEGYADLLGIKLDSTMTFDILGIEQKAIVKSIRKIDWKSFDPNFFISFSSGILEDAPQTFIASIETSNVKVEELQADLYENLPNVSSIDVRRVFTKITTVLSSLNLIFQWYGKFILFLGIIIIIGLMELHREDRMKDFKNFHLIGIGTPKLKEMYLMESFFLVLFASVIAVLIQISASYFILYKAFEVEYFPYNTVGELVLLIVLVFLALLGRQKFLEKKDFDKFLD